MMHKVVSIPICYKLILIFVVIMCVFNFIMFYITCAYLRRPVREKEKEKCNGNVTNPAPSQVDIVMYDDTLCDSLPDLRWLFYVHSAPANREKRDLIRSSWGSPTVYRPGTTLLVFMLGQTDDPRLQTTIEEEYGQYGDIVQGDFMDTYRNLTLKAMLGLKWATTHCSKAAFFLKFDDDIVVNIFDWTEVLERESQGHSRVIMCGLWSADQAPIYRNNLNKWNVAPDEFPFPCKKTYPRYCAGWGVTMSRDVVEELYDVAVGTPFFWIDDVFLTGLVAGQLDDVHYINVMEHVVGFSDQNLTDPTMLMTHTDVGNFTNLWSMVLSWHSLT